MENLEHQNYSKREEETEGIVVGVSSSLNIMLYSLDSRDERQREESLGVQRGSMKGGTDEKRSVLTGLTAHGDTQLHTWQRRAFICG